MNLIGQNTISLLLLLLHIWNVCPAPSPQTTTAHQHNTNNNNKPPTTVNNNTETNITIQVTPPEDSETSKEETILEDEATVCSESKV